MSLYWNAQLRDWERTVHSQRKHIRELEAALATAREALEGIFLLISYANIHGVGPQPPSVDVPQPMKLSVEEFWNNWLKMGNIAAAALARFGGDK